MKKVLFLLSGIFMLTYFTWWIGDLFRNITDDFDPWNEYSSEEDPVRNPQTTTTASSGTTQHNNTERKSS